MGIQLALQEVALVGYGQEVTEVLMATYIIQLIMLNYQQKAMQ